MPPPPPGGATGLWRRVRPLAPPVQSKWVLPVPGTPLANGAAVPLRVTDYAYPGVDGYTTEVTAALRVLYRLVPQGVAVSSAQRATQCAPRGGGESGWTAATRIVPRLVEWGFDIPLCASRTFWPFCLVPTWPPAPSPTWLKPATEGGRPPKLHCVLQGAC